MSFINAIASWYLKKRIYQIELFMRHPVETQMEIFYRLVQTAADTHFGRQHGFASIASLLLEGMSEGGAT